MNNISNKNNLFHNENYLNKDQFSELISEVNKNNEKIKEYNDLITKNEELTKQILDIIKQNGQTIDEEQELYLKEINNNIEEMQNLLTWNALALQLINKNLF